MENKVIRVTLNLEEFSRMKKIKEKMQARTTSEVFRKMILEFNL